MSTSQTVPQWQRAIVIWTNIAISVVIVAALYFAQLILIPVAIATLFAFILTPFVNRVERIGVGRMFSVLLVVSIVGLLLIAAGWVIFAQVSGVASDLPVYTENINQRIRAVKRMGDSPTLDRLQIMFDDISNELVAPEPGENAPSPSLAVEEPVTPLASRISVGLGIMESAVVSIGLANVLLIFMLLRREALRNRLIRLAGNSHMNATTKAVDDTVNRVSRFLFTQFAINTGYGIALGTGLYFIGVSYAFLWGFLAILLRYIPYLGAFIAAAFPIGLSLAQFTGWWEPITVITLVILLEFITSQFFEPWLYGHSIGVSEVAMLVSAAFWTLLWGPIGLVLSAPLTVCLVVMGRHVSRLEFLILLLGDEPALEPHVTYYQRLLARDQDEAEELVTAKLKSSSMQAVYDDLLIPALNYAKFDRDRNETSIDEERFVLETTSEILEVLGERSERRANISDELDTEFPEQCLVVCPARDGEDYVALQMLVQALGSTHWKVHLLSADTLASELLEQVAIVNPALVCVASLPPGGLAHTRYLCKRLRTTFPDVKILVGRWGLNDDVESNRERLLDAGADQMATSLSETVQQLETWLPTVLKKGPISVAC
jgi:predicted PurR-regulated permease PerM